MISLNKFVIGSFCFGGRLLKNYRINMSSAEIPEPNANSIAFVTTTDETSAKILANLIITHKLAACVNIIPKITSIYHWEGKVNEDSEVLMMIKTKTSRIEDLIKFVRENHSYSVAEVISIPIEKGNPSYLDWIQKTVPDKYE